MKKQLKPIASILSITLSLIPFRANAEFVKSGESQLGNHFVEVTTPYRGNQNHVFFVHRIEFTEVDEYNVASMNILVEGNCKTSQWRSLEAYSYDPNGNQLNHITEGSKWVTAEPGTLFAVCSAV